MQPDTSFITFAQLLTPGGVVVAAATVLALVEVIKAGIPVIDRHVSGATMAFALSGVLYILTALALPQATADGYLAIAFAWISCATSAMGIRAGADHVANVRAGTAGIHTELAPVVVEDAGEPTHDPTLAGDVVVGPIPAPDTAPTTADDGFPV